MKGRAAVTLSNENGLSLSRPYEEPRSAANVRQGPACAPRQPGESNVVRHLGAGRPRWAR